MYILQDTFRSSLSSQYLSSQDISYGTETERDVEVCKERI